MWMQEHSEGSNCNQKTPRYRFAPQKTECTSKDSVLVKDYSN